MNSTAQWRKLTRLQSELVAACGDEDAFAQLYYDAINSFVAIDSCVTFLIGSDNAEHVFTHGKLRKTTAQKLAQNYISLFHKDPAWQELTGISKQKILWHMQGSSYGPLYKYHFFERNSLIDKVARIEQSSLGVCSCYLYRRRPSSAFSTQDIIMLELIFPFYTAAAAKHCEILQARKLTDQLGDRLQPQDFFACIEQVISERTAPLDVLTQRELEVCEHIFKGSSIHEIGKMLNLSVNSVATYRQRAYHRLSVGKIQELFALLFTAVENWRCRNGTQAPLQPPRSRRR
ncbi:MAG: helix-turn-helix transcriptional regulator [Gammaproteobacteria bacterium]|nr:helix-turn-helix transcriptional regulator [Gammaproteobacteria bacterium]